MLVLGWVDGFVVRVAALVFSVDVTGKGCVVRFLPNYAQNSLSLGERQLF